MKPPVPTATAGMPDQRVGRPATVPVPPSSPIFKLPTLQRNALRKLFDRPEFTPEEVARLGHRRLLKAEGIGQKGVVAITQWLAQHGLELQADPPDPRPPQRPATRSARLDLETALRLVRNHGYEIRPPEDDAGGSASAPHATPHSDPA